MQEKNPGGCVENTVSSFKLISFIEHFKNFGGQQRLGAATCQSLMSMRHCCSLSAIPWFVKLRRGIPDVICVAVKRDVRDIKYWLYIVPV